MKNSGAAAARENPRVRRILEHIGNTGVADGRDVMRVLWAALDRLNGVVRGDIEKTQGAEASKIAFSLVEELKLTDNDKGNLYGAMRELSARAREKYVAAKKPLDETLI